MWLLKSASRTSAAIRSTLRDYDYKERASLQLFDERQTSQEPLDILLKREKMLASYLCMALLCEVDDLSF